MKLKREVVSVLKEATIIALLTVLMLAGMLYWLTSAPQLSANALNEIEIYEGGK